MKNKSSGASLHLIGVPLLAAYVVGLNSFITQFCASRLSYHPLLGETLAGKFYAPFKWLAWQAAHYKAAPTTFNYSYLIFLAGIGGAILAYVLVIGLRMRRMQRHDDVHGTAHWATREEIETAGLLPRIPRGFQALVLRATMRTALLRPKSVGVYCGGWTDAKNTLYYLRHDGPEHVAVIAPTRSGKGVALVNPTLLTWPHSVVGLDLKGELYNGTAGWRSKYAKNAVYNFVPGSMSGNCRINPLSEIRLGTPFEVADVQNITTIIVDPSGKGMDRLGHFEKTAQQFLIGLILHVLYKTKEKDGRLAGLGDCGDEMSNPERPAEELYEEMMRNTHLNGMTHPVIAKAGAQQANRPEEERGSVLSTAMSFFSLYDDPIVRHNTAESTFPINDLMNAENPVTLFIGPRPEDKDRLKPLIRLIISQVLRVLLRPEIQFKNGREVAPHKHRLLLMLDEFPSFGKLEVVQENLAYMAGYGIKAYLIMQDVAQLWDDAAYGRNEQVLSNCHIRIVYAPNKPETAKWISDMSGTTTVVKEHVSFSGKRFGAVMQQASVSLQEQSRPLLTPDEIMRLRGPRKNAAGKIEAAGDVLVFVAGHAPIKGTQSLYFLDPTLNARWGLPYVQDETWSAPPSTIEPEPEAFVVA